MVEEVKRDAEERIKKSKEQLAVSSNLARALMQKDEAAKQKEEAAKQKEAAIVRMWRVLPEQVITVCVGEVVKQRITIDRRAEGLKVYLCTVPNAKFHAAIVGAPTPIMKGREFELEVTVYGQEECDSFFIIALDEDSSRAVAEVSVVVFKRKTKVNLMAIKEAERLKAKGKPIQSPAPNATPTMPAPTNISAATTSIPAQPTIVAIQAPVIAPLPRMEQGVSGHNKESAATPVIAPLLRVEQGVSGHNDRAPVENKEPAAISVLNTKPTLPRTQESNACSRSSGSRRTRSPSSRARDNAYRQMYKRKPSPPRKPGENAPRPQPLPPLPEVSAPTSQRR